MKLQLSVFATVALSATTSVLAQDPPYLTLNAYGTPLQISNNEVEYDQNQNHGAGIAPTISADHNELHSTGNRWSAYALPSPQEIYENSVLQFDFKLDVETVDGFQALCLDADVEETGPNGQCFVLSTSQGWIDNMLNVAQITGVNETSHHSIPIGHFFTGTVNYLAFIQDSDGDAVDKSTGDSTISNLRLIQEERNMLKLEINGQEEELENHQYSFKFKSGNQDTSDWLMSISEDGHGVQVNGNHWKALQLNEPYTITHFTVLEFDIVVTEPAEFHAICLGDDLNHYENVNDPGGDDGTSPCVTFMTPQDPSAFHYVTTEIVANVPQRLVLPFGQMLELYGGQDYVAKYIAFVQDNDAGDRRGGRSTFANIRLYEEDRTNIEIEVFGQNVSIANIQDTIHTSNSVQDSKDHIMSVSADGRTVGAHGNSWKSFKLDTDFEVKQSTVLKFDFTVPHEAEINAICLLNSQNMHDNRKDCFATAGRDITKSDNSIIKLNPMLNSGESASYEVLLGSYFTGNVAWLGFGQDNDKVYYDSRAAGESYWSNIEIYQLPSLTIGLDAGTKRSAGTSFAIENVQLSYDQNQDSTPVNDHLLIISDDGSSIRTNGNAWRALPLNPPKSATELGDMVVSFDYTLHEKGEFHGICFEDNLEFGDVDSPSANEYDPRRCFLPNVFETVGNPNYFDTEYHPEVGETHRFVMNLGKMFDRFYELKYIVIITDNDEDKSVGDVEISNIHITTSLTSCLANTGYDFEVSDCTVDNFLDGVKTTMDANNCLADDPLLELLALFDLKTEMDVYKQIEFICSSSYEPSTFDFTKAISSESQLVNEFIDGGTVLNYENDSQGSSLAKDGAGIATTDQNASSKLLSWPKHHALDHCDVGAAMCCWVDSRGTTALEDNSDVCYVNMKASRRTAHVADGYSIYGDSHEGSVNCHGFAWGTDGGSIASALKGNALFKVGFMSGLYSGMKGNVEQVPGAPMCGCMDRMPVVTNAECTKVTDATSKVTVTYDSTIGAFSSVFTMGTIQYDDCGSDLNSYYKTLVGADSPDAAYMDTRLVGDGNCHGAIDDFLAGKGLVKSA